MGNMKILLSVTVIAMLALSVGVAWADEGAVEPDERMLEPDECILELDESILDEDAVGDPPTDLNSPEGMDISYKANVTVKAVTGLYGFSPDYIGVYGRSDGTDSTDRGVYGYCAEGRGVYGRSKYIGVYGKGKYGGYFTTNKGSVYPALHAVTTNSSGRGLRGYATATSGTNYGVVGRSDSPKGYGGYFYNNGKGIGVFGSGGKYAGYFNGKVYVRDNVGIGTTKPKTKLHVVGNRIRLQNAGKTLDMRADGSAVDLQTETSDLYIRSTGKGHDVIINPFAPDGNVGIGTASPKAKLDVAGFTRSLGVSVNNGANTGVGRGLWLWTPTDPNHVIYSANPKGKSPANKAPARGYFDAGHRLRLRTATGQGFLFENNQEVALVDIDSDNGRLWTKGSTYSGGTKNFLIDHPLDPEHKELIHSTLEGPEAGVFYRGEAQLSGGEATVMLPDYFEALTRTEGRTVLLTPKFEGDEQISMLAASGVKDGKFRVRMIDSTNPSQNFYWEVKAVRADVDILDVERTKTSSQ